MSEKFKIGDKVQVKYQPFGPRQGLKDSWLDVTVTKIKKVTPELAAALKDDHPTIKVGDHILVCDDGSGEKRSFMPAQGSVRRPQ